MSACFGFFKEKGTVIHSHENGCSDSPSLPYSEKAVLEVLEKPLHGIDENLPEFSEALRTVAKALRLAAEGKASAQAEAAEWKRKFEQEKARNSQQGCKGLASENHSANVPSKRASETQIPNQFEVSPLENEHCCGENGICNHEVLQDGELASNSELVKRRFLRKASFRLSWNDSKKGNRYKHDVVSFERGNIGTTERSSKQISLKWESQPQSVLVLAKPSSTSVRLLCSELVRWLKEQKNLNIYVEPRVRSELLEESSFYNFVQIWKDDKEVLLLHKKVDFVVTLGGDGTVLWTASLFKGPVPPVVPFNMGSLGFMTPFHSESYKESLDAVLQGPVSITLRHRLKCSILRATANDDSERVEPYYVLNEVTIDRGVSPYLTNLKCYFDDIYVTCVQGDGLILATTSGSTAYSLAAGGSMVHPQVPGILFTPISPHSLSFRPLILPEHVTLRVEVPTTSRGPAWVSFDGKGRTQLAPGDSLKCSMAPWPVPTACPRDSMVDFLKSIQEGLHWNVRKTQACDGSSVLST